MVVNPRAGPTPSHQADYRHSLVPTGVLGGKHHEALPLNKDFSTLCTGQAFQVGLNAWLVGADVSE